VRWLRGKRRSAVAKRQEERSAVGKRRSAVAKRPEECGG
jgi:hypothetical protein